MSADRDNLEAWLREHPAAHDDLADLLRLRELYQSVSPPMPEEAAWNAVHARLHKALGQIPRPRPWWAIAAGVAAAAILVALLIPSWWTTSVMVPTGEMPVPSGLRTSQLGETSVSPVGKRGQRVVEPFPVAEPGDVTIISMDARDVAALVVGEPPVGGDLEFARPEDVRLIRCERCPFSGRQARPEPGEEVLMFVAAAAVAPSNE
jgi:hypothetical protein